jgi:hypothetical protein
LGATTFGGGVGGFGGGGDRAWPEKTKGATAVPKDASWEKVNVSPRVARAEGSLVGAS